MADDWMEQMAEVKEAAERQAQQDEVSGYAASTHTSRS